MFRQLCELQNKHSEQADAGPPGGLAVADKARMLDEYMSVLKEWDQHYILDDSGSMDVTDDGEPCSRWEQMREVLGLLLPLGAIHDTNGVDVTFLNDPKEYTLKKTDDISGWIAGLALRGGQIYIDRKLGPALQSHLAAARRGPVKPRCFIVVTDGTPSDPQALNSVIVKFCQDCAAARLGPKKLAGISFYQIGCDRGAAAYLAQLDDQLEGAYGIPDIVDCVPSEPGVRGSLRQRLQKALLGSIIPVVDQDLYLRSRTSMARELKSAVRPASVVGARPAFLAASAAVGSPASPEVGARPAFAAVPACAAATRSSSSTLDRT